MPSSAIPVFVDSTEESVGSSVSLIILSDPDSEAPPSHVHHVVADHESDPYEEDPSEDDPSETAYPLSTQAIPPPKPYEATIARWRAVVLSCSSSSTVPTPSIQIAIAPPAPLPIVPVSPVLPLRPTILVLPGQDIPFGQPYRTLPDRVRMLLTARKRVHPFPVRIPANRRRFRQVSSSSSPSPRKRRRVLPSSSSSPSSEIASSSSSGTSHS
ncbi:hypothetical protein Tco_0080111 [Tanacetum coccineum]